MLIIRLPKSQWGKAWRAMIEVGPVRLIAADPVFEVLPAHLELLNAPGFTFEVVPPRPRPSEKRRHGRGETLEPPNGKSAADSFRQGWKEALSGETLPIDRLWEEVDA